MIGLESSIPKEEEEDMANLVTLYHGSSRVIREPEFGRGRANNDYGLGFYCTESDELAKE